jgi:integrase
MDKEQEWLASLLKENTKLHHAKSLMYLKEYLKKSPEEFIALRQQEGKRFNTRMVMFWNWLQEEKGLSKSTSSSYVFGASAFFSYYDLDLKLKGKIPDTQMKLDFNIPTLENLQTMFRLSDLQSKTLLSLMRDVPCRVGDLVSKVIPKMSEKEFLIESEKENVVGKVYLSNETLELSNQLDKAGQALPTTKRGIAKMLERMCKTAGIPAFNPHLMRKIFFTTASNLNINRDIIKVLTFKSVGKDILTYLLNREELRKAWQEITNAIPLENKSSGNGKVTSLEEDSKLFAAALYEVVKPVMERMRLEKLRQGGQKEGLGLLEMEAMPTDPKEGLKLFLKLRKGEDKGQ